VRITSANHSIAKSDDRILIQQLVAIETRS
jgi:hypothetical protein